MGILELFKYMISCKSETPNDGGLLDFITTYLPDFTPIRIDVGGVKNLFLYKRFGDGDHLCFAGHVDVVPAGNGWNSNPYEAFLKDGYIYGRGTQDMKSGIAAFTEAIKSTKNFRGTLSLLITSDEEGEALHGTVEMLEYLKENNMLPHYAVVAEPTCHKLLGDAIKVGRRGSINGLITIKGKQGHVAYPDNAINPIDIVAPRLAHIAGVNIDNGDEHFAPSRCVITDIRAGMQVSNVTPSELTMMFNVRNTTLTGQKEIRSFVARHLKGLDFDLKLTQNSSPFLTDENSKVVKNIESSIKKITKIKPKHTTIGGTSDARFFAAVGVKVIEFGVVNDTIHSINERVKISEVEGLYKVFTNLIEEWK